MERGVRAAVYWSGKIIISIVVKLEKDDDDDDRSIRQHGKRNPRVLTLRARVATRAARESGGANRYLPASHPHASPA